MRRLVPLVLSAAVLVLLAGAACGEDDGGGGGSDTAGSRTVPVTEVTVKSPDISYDVGTIYVPAGEEVTITYENDDKGVAHNLHIKHEAVGGEEPKTKVAVGPDVQTITFTMDEPGEYRYVCDVHPQMRGTLVVVG